MNPTKPNELELLRDGVGLQVNFLDGSNAEIRVRKIPIRHLDRLATALGREAKEVEVYIDRDEAFVSSLCEESFEAIIEKGRELNFTSCEKWLKRNSRVLASLTNQDGLASIAASAIEKVVANAKKSESEKS